MGAGPLQDVRAWILRPEKEVGLRRPWALDPAGIRFGSVQIAVLQRVRINWNIPLAIYNFGQWARPSGRCRKTDVHFRPLPAVRC